MINFYSFFSDETIFYDSLTENGKWRIGNPAIFPLKKPARDENAEFYLFLYFVFPARKGS